MSLKWIAITRPVFKGIVHPKMKMLSSYTHPQVVPNLYECLCSTEHKGRYSEECRKQRSSGAPFTSIVFFSYYESQWSPKTAWLQTFFKISSFVFGRTKKFIPVWNYFRLLNKYVTLYVKYYDKMHYEEELDLFCSCIRANISIMLHKTIYEINSTHYSELTSNHHRVFVMTSDL